MRSNLTPGIGKSVTSFVSLLLQNLELNGYHGGKEHIIKSLGLNADIELLNTIGHAADQLFDAADQAAKSWGREAPEFSKTFDDSYFCGGYCEWYLQGERDALLDYAIRYCP